MELTRRSFLAACLAAEGARTFAQSSVGGPNAAWEALTAPLTEPGSAVAPQGFPWNEIGQLLRARYRDLRRHFVFEYYPWYGNDPFRHWQQWDREPPVDIAASSVPLLGPYDSRATAVIEQHARWIADAGVGVVNLSWWGRGSFSDQTTSLVMDVMSAHDIHVAFHLEPYGPQRVERLTEDLSYLLTEFGEKRRWDCFFFHERADRSQGPVFKLFRTTLPEQIIDCHGERQDIADYTPDSAWRRATDAARTAFDGTFDHLTLLSDTWDAARVAAAGLDGIAIYDPVIEREEWLDHALTASRLGLVYSFNTNPGLDEIGRRGLPPDSCLVPRPFLPTAPDLAWTKFEDRERSKFLSEARIRETLEWSLLLQIHPWLGNAKHGFFLIYITSFNEWHEGHQFEPMKSYAVLTPEELVHNYHNPNDGFYRLDQLTDLLRRLQ